MAHLGRRLRVRLRTTILTAPSPSGQKLRRCVKMLNFDTPPTFQLFIYENLICPVITT